MLNRRGFSITPLEGSRCPFAADAAGYGESMGMRVDVLAGWHARGKQKPARKRMRTGFRGCSESDGAKSTSDERARIGCGQTSAWTCMVHIFRLQMGFPVTRCRKSMSREIHSGRLSIKLCLSRKSSSFLKAGLEHGVELRKGGGNGACDDSPSTILQR
jgi:hypothetical protein